MLMDLTNYESVVLVATRLEKKLEEKEYCQQGTVELDNIQNNRSSRLEELLEKLIRKMVINQENFKKNKKVLCFNCKKPGHYKIKCPYLKKSDYVFFSALNSDKLLFDEIIIDNIKFRGLIDTGAERTFILFQAFNLLKGYKVDKCTFDVMLANGEIAKTFGEVMLTTVFKNKKIKIKTIIMDTKHDLILGLDFLALTDVNINIKNREIVLNTCDLINKELFVHTIKNK